MAKFEGYTTPAKPVETKTDIISNTSSIRPSAITENQSQSAPAPRHAIYAEPPATDVGGLKLETFQSNLAHSLSILSNEVMKGYVTDISELELITPDKETLKELDSMQFFRITELVYEKDEFAVHKLSTVLHTLSQKPCTVALMIRSDGTTNHFFLGVRSTDKKYSTGTMRSMLKNSLLGMFPGSRIDEYMIETLEKDLSIISDETNAVSGVTCIADYKHNDQTVHNEDFIQGLEKFVRSMSGKQFTTVIIADSMGRDESLIYAVLPIYLFLLPYLYHHTEMRFP